MSDLGAPDAQSGSVDTVEVAKFDAMAEEWWDVNGKFKPLHAMNPIRLDYITRQIEAEFDLDRSARKAFKGLELIDVGCGGGLLCEPMARLGASVTGVDASEESIPVARAHARQMGLDITYRQIAAEEVVAEGRPFDVVLAMEVIEHVAEPSAFLATCAALLKPGGLLVVSTLNRTPQAYALAIVGAERIMGWLPKGTHDWAKFIRPNDLAEMISGAGLDPVDRKGMVFNPLSWDWALSTTNFDVNYVMAATKPG